MPQFRVVLVEPLNDGNVGAVARAMKNFGLDDLVLVRPCAVGEEATKRAMHGLDILKSAKTVFSEEEAMKGIDYVAASSGIDTTSEKKFPRISMTPRAFAEKVKGVYGRIAILFGREDFGLDNQLIKRSDDPFDGAFVQWNHIGIAIHKTDIAPVLRDLHGIAG